MSELDKILELGEAVEIVVVDEKGQKHSHVHGVLAREWFKMIRAAALALKDMGIEPAVGPAWCDDPDCSRVNRRDTPLLASYRLFKDVAPVRPADPTNDKERQISEGHPYLEDSHLCRTCAIIATAKRLIDKEAAS